MSGAFTGPTRQHVISEVGVCGGKPCVAGTRIRVWDIATLAQSGLSPDEIISHYPKLTLADVHAALAFYYDNQREIDQTALEDERFAESLRKKSGPGPLETKIATSDQRIVS